MSANNINTFAVEPLERFLYAGNRIGEILIFEIDGFKTVQADQAHKGSIETIAVHRSLPYMAAFGHDRRITLWKLDAKGMPRRLFDIPLRPIQAGDGLGFFKSTSQALAFHDTKPRLAGHTGDCALFEADFDDYSFRVLNCHRPHDRVDFATVRYARNSDAVLTGSVRGEAAMSAGGKVLRRWDFGTGNNFQVLHWFEPLEGSVYLLASDAQRVIRLDIEDRESNVQGEILARDHMEHVTYNKRSGRAFCSGFDRNVYELDPATCAKKGLIWKAPFKLRWIKTLEHDPDVMIVQCRNGGLFKISVETGRVLAQIKTTPDALWSAAILGGEVLTAGESNLLGKYAPSEVDAASRVQLFSKTELALGDRDSFYVKRMAVRESDGVALLGRTNGDVVKVAGKITSRLLCRLPAAVRDLAFLGEEKHAVAACEDGKIYVIDTEIGIFEPIYESDLPIWALAYNAERRLLAFGRRVESIHLMNMDTREVETICAGTRFCKRIKWLDSEQLLIVSSENLIQYDALARQSKFLIKGLANTIEDFAWDVSREYLVVVNYSRDILLFDLKEGVLLDTHGDAADYSKGVVFLHPEAGHSRYPADFIVVGREGKPKYMRIHDDRIISYGYFGLNIQQGGRYDHGSLIEQPFAKRERAGVGGSIDPHPALSLEGEGIEIEELDEVF